MIFIIKIKGYNKTLSPKIKIRLIQTKMHINKNIRLFKIISLI